MVAHHIFYSSVVVGSTEEVSLNQYVHWLTKTINVNFTKFSTKPTGESLHIHTQHYCLKIKNIRIRKEHFTMKLFGALLVTLMASSACVGSSQVLTGSSSGDFVMLGSLCFPPGADDQVTITTTTTTPNQMILFFDDQSSSFGDINAGKNRTAGKTCFCAARQTTGLPQNMLGCALACP